ncbi:MAG: response regulator transcription factor [Planctomycetaceae bacterium]|nr:response regulator transcription factor [Planctomycetaceae bacterium]
MVHKHLHGPAAQRSSEVDGLTDRELEVFELIGQGNTRQQIASKLFISPRTVETHRQNIKQKLNLQNSAQLIRSAIQWVLEGY